MQLVRGRDVLGFGGRRGNLGVALPLHAALPVIFRLRAMHGNSQTGHILLGIRPARWFGVWAFEPQFLPTRRPVRERAAHVPVASGAQKPPLRSGRTGAGSAALSITRSGDAAGCGRPRGAPSEQYAHTCRQQPTSWQQACGGSR